MISFEEALQKVLALTASYGNESIKLEHSLGRILAETIVADRDFPPFNRSTKDGIAINFDGLKSQNQQLKVEGIAQAGNPQLSLKDTSACIEVMTGAIVPNNADTVVMYEHTSKQKDGFSVDKPIAKGQNIHPQASDIAMGEVLLHPGEIVTAAEIGVLASVGKADVVVKKTPKIAVISTGNELVDVSEVPEPYQIRKSNSHTVAALLQKEGILADIHHILDDPATIKERLASCIHGYDVLILSGGVSKGKYDYLPELFEELGVKKIFHRVRQRPGKPFWFGKQDQTQTTVFSFPGNPVSTFVNYQVYFKPWLNKTLGVQTPQFAVILEGTITNKIDLTVFVGVKTTLKNGTLYAQQVSTTGSGDLIGLSKIDGVVQLNPNEAKEKDDIVPFIPTKSIF
ncbi:molybdopterin molybdotransferase MoeA [Flagellimonas nanhaiensis]|uniref:Molybdopterin molybdenumtransferase n=1 Tax=Flagellimonas nanhaiensis TaxID=2292706 RepID=A0A371JUY5_9FLAO|nr:molybdopterin molybdotransferase MoeA [Allomuricauda nanhaiensis]RDY61586.1 molybdopterin molybdenumtransferase MoeA [Allomuricauda nanhaiensis]